LEGLNATHIAHKPQYTFDQAIADLQALVEAYRHPSRYRNHEGHTAISDELVGIILALEKLECELESLEQIGYHDVVDELTLEEIRAKITKTCGLHTAVRYKD